jgi:hypothetical protein
MTCPSCTGYGQTGYDRRQRPIPCRKCRGTGVIGPAEPQRPAPTAPPDPVRRADPLTRRPTVPELSPEGTAELLREMESPPADTPERQATFARISAWAERERAAQEERIREIVREEIAAYWASVSRSTSYGFYLRDRDEPPAAPPVRGVNTTERL